MIFLVCHSNSDSYFTETTEANVKMVRIGRVPISREQECVTQCVCTFFICESECDRSTLSPKLQVLALPDPPHPCLSDSRGDRMMMMFITTLARD